MSHFDDVVTMNTVAGNNPVTVANENSASEIFTAFTRQIGLIRSEFEELCVGIATGNVREIRDGVADVLVTTDGLFHRLGLKFVEFPLLVPVRTTRLVEPLLDEDRRTSAIARMEGPLEQMEYFIQNGVEEMDLNQVQMLALILVQETTLFAHRLGINVEADMRAVFDSNMSKFDTNPTDAEATVQKYLALGVETVVVPFEGTVFDGIDFAPVRRYVVKSARQQTGNDGVVYPAGKFLKSFLFQEPVFQSIDGDVEESILFQLKAV